MTWPGKLALSLRTSCADDERQALNCVAEVEATERKRAAARIDEAYYEMRNASTVFGAGLGTSVTSTGRRFRVTMPHDEMRTGGHWLITGATGTGKTYLVTALLLQMMKNASPGLVVIDMKGELASLLRDLVVPSYIASWPDEWSRTLARRFAVIAPFDQQATPPLQVLARDLSLPITVQAHEVASSFGRTIGRDLGVLQTNVLKQTLLLAIDQGLTLVDVPALLQDEGLRRGAVMRCRLPDVRAYFAERFPRERNASVASLLARLDSVLMYPALRRMLVAPGMIAFDRLIEQAITVVDLGRAPAGMADVARFFGQIIFQKLVRAIFERTGSSLSPVTVIADEFQALLSPEAIDDFERFLTQARSQRVFLWSMFQQAAQLERSAPHLLRVLRANTNVQIMFRSSLEDARVIADVLPTTGQVLRDRPGFPDPRTPPTFLSQDEERRVLLAQVPSMPDRCFWFWNKHRPYGAIAVSSPAVPVTALRRSAASLPPELREAVRGGVLAMHPTDLRRAERRRQARLNALANREHVAAPAATVAHEPDAEAGDIEASAPPSRSARLPNLG